MQSYLKLYYDVINVMLLSDDVTYQFVLSSVVSKHLLLALSVLCLFVELTMVAERYNEYPIVCKVYWCI